MNIQKKHLKSLLRLWSLTLAVTLLSLQITNASVIETTTTAASIAIAPASASVSKANDLKAPRPTTTTTTLQLTQHAIDDDFESKEKLLTTTKQVTSKEKIIYTTSTHTTSTLSSSTSSTSSLAASTASDVQGKGKKDEVEMLRPTTMQSKNNDELEREIMETDLKQVTENIMEQQQPEQPTTEVSWQRETDMHKQSTGNAKNEIKITATQTHTQTPPSPNNNAMTITPHESSTSTILPHAFNSKNNGVAATTHPAEQNKLDHVEPEEITANDEMESTTLSLEQDKQTIDDLKPIIKDANEKLLKERTIFANKPKDIVDEWKQNLMPNELDYEDNKAILSKKFEHNINWSPYLHPATPVTDFTGKLLQEQDGVITEIEQKFRLNDFASGDETKATKKPGSTTHKTSLELTQTTTFSKEPKPAALHTVNHKLLDINQSPILSRSPPVEFIERRVKKSFDFPMHRVASDAQHLQQHFDFANTKFNSNNNEQHDSQDAKTNTEGQQKENTQPSRPQPEFSTTKFYNSKELYNEMLQHKTKLQPPSPYTTTAHDKDIKELNGRVPSLALNSFAVLHSPKMAKLEEIHETKEPQQQQKSLAIKKVTVKATKYSDVSSAAPESSTATTTASTSTTTTLKITPAITKAAHTLDLGSSALTEMPLAALVKTKKFQKELKRAKLLIKSMMPLQNATITATARATTVIGSGSNNIHNNDLKDRRQQNATTILPLQTQTQTQLETRVASHAAASIQTTPYTTITASPTKPTSLMPQTSLSPSTATAVLSVTSTNHPKTSLHPIVRPRILSRLQEKINSLECELQTLPQDSHLWRGNETHELLLPIMTPENCKNDKDCTAMMVSWEGEAEIQSSDILIVEINDALLTPKDINLTTSAHNTQVYQVTRSGHEHCDVTEGILLDITPLIVDGRKLVTLYDKDLTEGVNLLIVVSELWGAQCVRLKVTTKTENCGESADCSGKGICYSNYDMEEYECQCCSGFAGPHCEEIDACTPSPCTNNGICVDLSQGHEGNSYQCLCPYGYTGKNCQYELDPCNPAECMNGGSCVGNSTHFRCECTPGYTGPLCQHSLNECESSPCIHGICVDEEDGFRCFCQPGFAGELCNFEYNECESNPCQNGGECIDHIGSYECHCSKGYTGNRCQIKVDFCANKPCPEGRRCIDHGNEYSCECLGGRNGPDCNEMQRTQCNVNPCTHGGTCWSSGDSFYCACRPGYTGSMCEDEFVVETVVSSSEFMVDDTSARNFNDKSFGSSVVLKSPIELHNAYTAAIVLALVIFFVALYLTICHCKVNQTYRKFSTRTYGFLPILGFRLRTKQATSKISRHWLSGKGLGIGNVLRTGVGSGGGGGGGGAMASSSTTSALHATTATTSSQRNNVGHLPTAKASSSTQKHTHVGQLNERPFQRHLAMNLENDMYYTVDFSENSQHSPLIQ